MVYFEGWIIDRARSLVPFSLELRKCSLGGIGGDAWGCGIGMESLDL
jgi:hypothetical protein